MVSLVSLGEGPPAEETARIYLALCIVVVVIWGGE